MRTYTIFIHTLAHHVFPATELLNTVSFFVRHAAMCFVEFIDNCIEVHAVILHGFHPSHFTNLLVCQGIRFALLCVGNKSDEDES